MAILQNRDARVVGCEIELIADLRVQAPWHHVPQVRGTDNIKESRAQIHCKSKDSRDWRAADDDVGTRVGVKGHISPASTAPAYVRRVYRKEDPLLLVGTDRIVGVLATVHTLVARLLRLTRSGAEIEVNRCRGLVIELALPIKRSGLNRLNRLPKNRVLDRNSKK